MSDHFHSPITIKDGITLLGQLDLIEFAVMASISGDASGPLTASPPMRRSLATIIADSARALDQLAARIDPLRMPVLPAPEGLNAATVFADSLADG